MTNEHQDREQSDAKRPSRMLKAPLLAAALCMAAFAAPNALAQTVWVSCPNGGPPGLFYPSESACATTQLNWPPDTCTCTGSNSWRKYCSGGMTGTGENGVLGCRVSCEYGPQEWDQPCGDVDPKLKAPPIPPPPQPPPPKPAPRPCPGTSVPFPVAITTGEMYFSQTDATVGELTFVRTFNTARVLLGGRYGAFGPGWNTSFETRVRVLGAHLLEVRHGDGDAIVYADPTAIGTYTATYPTSSETWVEAIAGGFKRSFRAGGYETFDTAGRMVSVVDANGNVTTYTRDSLGRLTQVERFGRSLQLSYAGTDSKPVELRGPGGMLLASYSYNSSGRLDQVTYPDSSGYRYVYDASGRLTLMSDLADKMIEAHEYDGSGRATTSEIGEGREKLTLSYGTNQTTVTDAVGNVTVYDYLLADHIPRVKKVTGPCTSCGGGGDVQEWTYDAVGNITSYKDGASEIWTYTYNSTNDMTTETDPLGRVTTYTYDSQGRVLTRSTPGEGTTTTTHGAAGPLTITDAISRTTTLAYTAQGKLQTITDPRSKTTTLAYNATGDLTSVTDPLSHATTFGYDAFGRRTTMTDALSHTTSKSYDAVGRASRITNHDGTHTDFKYDKGGRLTEVTDPLGRITRYLYDRYGRLETVVDAINGATRYGYDAMSNLTSLTDAKGNTTAFEYDTHKRVKKVIYPGGAFESFTYDTAGRLATKTDRKSVVTTYTYDDVGRLTGKTYSDGTTPAVSYTYNTAGKLATAANGTDTLTWTYDLAGQLLSEQSTKNSSTVAYTYDLGGNRLTVSLDGTLFVSYAYDDASRLTTITRGSNVFGFGYDNANRRTSLSYPNGVNTSYSYDNLNRLLNLQANHVPTSTNITNFNYTYDAAGNRLTKQQPDYTEAYKYDPLYRLTQAERAGSLTGVQTWSYDAVGNRLTNQKDGAVTTSSYNEKNQLTSTAGGGTMLWRGSLDEPGTVNFTSALVNGKPARMLPGNVFEALLPMQAGSNTVTLEARDTTGNVATKSYSVSVSGDSATYTYDANGNLNQKVEGADTWVYEWTAENELKRVLKNGVEQASFKYDPKGRRVEKVAGGVTKAYAYSDQRVFRETGGATAFYVQGPGIDEPLAREESGVLAYRQADALWSIVATTNAAGSLTATTRYDAWGSIESGTPGAEAFTGREWDPETQLYFYRARHLDTRAGRFLSEDPLGFRSGVNFYSYVHNNPVLLNDPLGLQECCDCPSQSWYVDGGLTFSLSLGLGFSAGFGNMICVERPWVKRPIVIRCTSLGIQFGAGVAGDVQLPGNPSVTGVCRLNPMGPPLSSTGWTAGAGPVTASTDTDWRTTNVSLGISVSAGVAHQSCFIYPR